MVKEKIKSTVQPSLHTDKKLQGYVKNPVLAYPCFLFVLPAVGLILPLFFPKAGLKLPPFSPEAGLKLPPVFYFPEARFIISGLFNFSGIAFGLSVGFRHSAVSDTRRRTAVKNFTRQCLRGNSFHARCRRTQRGRSLSRSRRNGHLSKRRKLRTR